jgi:nonsense-mediated mRNA decay protein 3
LEIARVSDFGNNEKTFTVHSHLGDIINYNDTVLGYDLEAITLSELDDFFNEKHRRSNIPEIVIVKKTYPKTRKMIKKRMWKLKHLDKEAVDENNFHKKSGVQRTERDYEMFL